MNSSALRYLYFIILALIVAFADTGVCFQDEENEEPPFLIPRPRFVIRKNFLFTVDSSMAIVLGTGCTDADRIAADSLNSKLKAEGKPSLRILDEFAAMESRGIIIGAPERSKLIQAYLRDHKLAFTPEMEQEGYFLIIDSTRILISGKSNRSRYYGLQTFFQFLKQYRGTAVLPGLSIQDWPLLPIRGYCDDISRGQVSTLTHFKSIIRSLSQYKINVYSPYIEDMAAFSSHPEIGSGRGALTEKEIEELINYAAYHYIEVIPVFQTLAHQENILLNPKYSGLSEFPGSSTFNLSAEGTYNLLKELLGEMSNLFPSPYIHIGGDDAWEVGAFRSRQLVEEVGKGRVVASHYNAVARILKEYKKQVIVYGDMIQKYPGMIDRIYEKLWIADRQDGGQTMEYPSVDFFRKNKFSYLVSPSLNNSYRLFPDYRRGIANIVGHTRAGYRDGAIGELTSIWSGCGGEELRELNWFGCIFSAECGWSAGTADTRAFIRDFLAQFYGMSTTGFQEAFVGLWKVDQPIREGYANALLCWSYPFSMRFTAEEIKKAADIQQLGEWLSQQLVFIKGLVREGGGAMDYLIFTGNKAAWLGKKVLMAAYLMELEEGLAKQSPPPQKAKQEALSLLTAFKTETVKLRNEFVGLWKRTNKTEGLEFNLRRYDRQIQYCDEKINDIQSDRFLSDFRVPGEWIWSTNTRSGGDTVALPDTALFRKKFNLDVAVKSAYLQVRCFTLGRIFLNGKYVGEVTSRIPFSPLMWEKTVFAQTVGPDLLKKGENVLAVEGVFFDPAECGTKPGLHACLTLTTADGKSIDIASDGSWSVSRHAEEGWQETDFSKEWKQSVTMGAEPLNPMLEELRPNVREVHQ